MKNITIIFLVFGVGFAMGCAEEGLYIDTNCSPEEQDWAYEGVDQLNAVFGYERVQIQGVHKRTSDPLNDGISMMYCDDRVLPYVLGEVAYEDIYIFSKKLDNHDAWLNTFLHELGHFVGAEHIEDRNSVMYRYQTSTPVLEYTESDIQALLHTDI